MRHDRALARLGCVGRRVGDLLLGRLARRPQARDARLVSGNDYKRFIRPLRDELARLWREERRKDALAAHIKWLAMRKAQQQYERHLLYGEPLS